MPVDLSVHGLTETRRKLEQAAADLHGQPLLDGMHQATLLVERDARKNAPVDSGRLRASIASEVRVEGIGAKSVIGVVGSNVAHAPYQELGTRPHWPPIGAVETWARRHGMSAFLVARAISRRGTKAQRFLGRAFDTNKPRIVAILGQSVAGIVRRANR